MKFITINCGYSPIYTQMMKSNNFCTTVKAPFSKVRKVASITLIGLVMFPLFSFAQGKSTRYSSAQAKYSQRHSGNADALYADGIKIKRDLFMIDKVQMDRASKNDEIPADELYGGVWKDNTINCYKSVDYVPDNFRADLRGFTIPIKGIVTSKFGPRWGRMHTGIDLNLNTGDTVRAAFDGKIRIRSYNAGGYGYYITIRHPNGLETVYGHLSGFLVSENQNVKSGQPIALGGSTGRSTGPHLHFEIRFLGKPMDPARIVDFENKECYQDYYVINGSSFSPSRYASSDQVYAKYSSRSAKYSRDNKYTRGYVSSHKVSSGETLSQIAERNGTTVRKLCSLNGISKHTKLRPGKTLRIK